MLEIASLPKTIEMFPGLTDRVYFQNPDTKEFWFHATSVCQTLGFTNVSSALALHCDDDEKLQEIFNGKTTWFVSEAGCYGLAMGAKNEIAKTFKRWLKHEVLPKLRASGGYIMPNATSEQLEALQKQITDLQQQNSLLAQEHCYHELVNRFVVDNFIFKEGAYVMPNVVYDRFIYWYQNAELIDHLKVDGVPRLDKGRLFKELDRHFKTKQPKGSKKGFHFDPKNGFGDLENCQLVPKGKIGRFNHTTVYQLG